MMSLRLFTRNVTPRLTTSKQCFHASIALLDPDSSDSSSDDEKQEKKVVNSKEDKSKAQSVHRLNSLLQTMMKESKTPSKINVAVPSKKPRFEKVQIPKQNENLSERLFEEKLTGAAKDVATSLGGDTIKTESELLKKILTPSKSVPEPIDLSKLVMGMKIDRSKPANTRTTFRSDDVRAAMQKTKQYTPYQSEMKQPRREPINAPINAHFDHVDSGQSMNIFKADPEAVLNSNTLTLSTWDLLEKRELKLLVTHPPTNFIQQMIQWTNQGKLWRFPIDNEQDMNLEQEEHFSEHVFLEVHLEGWCPTKGPIRHFMELVCIGLSKNPYMSAKEKKEHIMWFKNYFDEKQDLLKELGVYGKELISGEKKQIEA